MANSGSAAGSGVTLASELLGAKSASPALPATARPFRLPRVQKFQRNWSAEAKLPTMGSIERGMTAVILLPLI